ncbi:hypothetical protein A3K93_10215 [Acinetobacter sp. NCu2D-2]|uniref:hypothetical protein n=1 Tax=Acinetobacter sp. NCu2D-2 TaxID=1608473 RepID=UPI0007CDA52C|nr:hypothetical protein [Acinetobacter sp. NCu2D-2]ANF82526.1 hypothetical protein A3K93_10215 [Acinetobacter sp. NCu2D-2]
MRLTTKQIITRIGETDQLFLQGNSPELALERADLRLQLVTLSQVRQEQVHFLQEAIVLLEQSRVEFEEMPLSLYINLSLHLAKAYMIFFELTKENRYAIITQQIMKPMVNYGHGDILFFLAYAYASNKEPSLTRHWLSKYAKTKEFDLELLQQHPAFEDYRSLDWFKTILKSRMH